MMNKLNLKCERKSKSISQESLQFYKCILNDMGLDYNARVKIPLRGDKREQCFSQFFENPFSTFDSCLAPSCLESKQVVTSVKPQVIQKLELESIQMHPRNSFLSKNSSRVAKGSTFDGSEDEAELDEVKSYNNISEKSNKEVLLPGKRKT